MFRRLSRCWCPRTTAEVEPGEPESLAPVGCLPKQRASFCRGAWQGGSRRTRRPSGGKTCRSRTTSGLGVRPRSTSSELCRTWGTVGDAARRVHVMVSSFRPLRRPRSVWPGGKRPASRHVCGRWPSSTGAEAGRCPFCLKVGAGALRPRAPSWRALGTDWAVLVGKPDWHRPVAHLPGGARPLGQAGWNEGMTSDPLGEVQVAGARANRADRSLALPDGSCGSHEFRGGRCIPDARCQPANRLASGPRGGPVVGRGNPGPKQNSLGTCAIPDRALGLRQRNREGKGRSPWDQRTLS